MKVHIQNEEPAAKGGSTGPGWKAKPFLSKPNFSSVKDNYLAYHPGPISPPGDDGSPLKEHFRKVMACSSPDFSLVGESSWLICTTAVDSLPEFTYRGLSTQCMLYTKISVNVSKMLTTADTMSIIKASWGRVKARMCSRLDRPGQDKNRLRTLYKWTRGCLIL